VILNGQQIESVAAFSYDDKTDRTQSKGSDELFVEGYIAQNTVLNVTVGGDLDAFNSAQALTIDGSDSSIVAYGSGAHALGKNNLGSQPPGGAQNDFGLAADAAAAALRQHLAALQDIELDQLLDERYQRYRLIGAGA